MVNLGQIISVITIFIISKKSVRNTFGLSYKEIPKIGANNEVDIHSREYTDLNPPPWISSPVNCIDTGQYSASHRNMFDKREILESLNSKSNNYYIPLQNVLLRRNSTEPKSIKIREILIDDSRPIASKKSNLDLKNNLTEKTDKKSNSAFRDEYKSKPDKFLNKLGCPNTNLSDLYNLKFLKYYPESSLLSPLESCNTHIDEGFLVNRTSDVYSRKERSSGAETTPKSKVSNVKNSTQKIKESKSKISLKELVRKYLHRKEAKNSIKKYKRQMASLENKHGVQGYYVDDDSAEVDQLKAPDVSLNSQKDPASSKHPQFYVLILNSTNAKVPKKFSKCNKQNSASQKNLKICPVYYKTISLSDDQISNLFVTTSPSVPKYPICNYPKQCKETNFNMFQNTGPPPKCYLKPSSPSKEDYPSNNFNLFSTESHRLSTGPCIKNKQSCDIFSNLFHTTAKPIECTKALYRISSWQKGNQNPYFLAGTPHTQNEKLTYAKDAFSQTTLSPFLVLNYSIDNPMGENINDNSITIKPNEENMKVSEKSKVDNKKEVNELLRALLNNDLTLQKCLIDGEEDKSKLKVQNEGMYNGNYNDFTHIHKTDNSISHAISNKAEQNTETKLFPTRRHNFWKVILVHESDTGENTQDIKPNISSSSDDFPGNKKYDEKAYSENNEKSPSENYLTKNVSKMELHEMGGRDNQFMDNCYDFLASLRIPDDSNISQLIDKSVAPSFLTKNVRRDNKELTSTGSYESITKLNNKREFDRLEPRDITVGSYIISKASERITSTKRSIIDIIHELEAALENAQSEFDVLPSEYKNKNSAFEKNRKNAVSEVYQQDTTKKSSDEENMDPKLLEEHIKGPSLIDLSSLFSDDELQQQNEFDSGKQNTKVSEFQSEGENITKVEEIDALENILVNDPVLSTENCLVNNSQADSNNQLPSENYGDQQLILLLLQKNQPHDLSKSKKYVFREIPNDIVEKLVDLNEIGEGLTNKVRRSNEQTESKNPNVLRDLKSKSSGEKKEEHVSPLVLENVECGEENLNSLANDVVSQVASTSKSILRNKNSKESKKHKLQIDKYVSNAYRTLFQDQLRTKRMINSKKTKKNKLNPLENISSDSHTYLRRSVNCSGSEEEYNSKFRALQSDLQELQNSIISQMKSGSRNDNTKNLTLQIKVIVDVVNNTESSEGKGDEPLKKRHTKSAKEIADDTYQELKNIMPMILDHDSPLEEELIGNGEKRTDCKNSKLSRVRCSKEKNKYCVNENKKSLSFFQEDEGEGLKNITHLLDIMIDSESRKPIPSIIKRSLEYGSHLRAKRNANSKYGQQCFLFRTINNFNPATLSYLEMNDFHMKTADTVEKLLYKGRELKELFEMSEDPCEDDLRITETLLRRQNYILRNTRNGGNTKCYLKETTSEINSNSTQSSINDLVVNYTLPAPAAESALVNPNQYYPTCKMVKRMADKNNIIVLDKEIAKGIFKGRKFISKTDETNQNNLLCGKQKKKLIFPKIVGKVFYKSIPRNYNGLGKRRFMKLSPERGKYGVTDVITFYDNFNNYWKDEGSDVSLQSNSNFTQEFSNNKLNSSELFEMFSQLAEMRKNKTFLTTKKNSRKKLNMFSGITEYWTNLLKSTANTIKNFTKETTTEFTMGTTTKSTVRTTMNSTVGTTNSTVGTTIKSTVGTTIKSTAGTTIKPTVGTTIKSTKGTTKKSTTGSMKTTTFSGKNESSMPVWMYDYCLTDFTESNNVITTQIYQGIGCDDTRNTSSPDTKKTTKKHRGYHCHHHYKNHTVLTEHHFHPNKTGRQNKTETTPNPTTDTVTVTNYLRSTETNTKNTQSWNYSALKILKNKIDLAIGKIVPIKQKTSTPGEIKPEYMVQYGNKITQMVEKDINNLIKSLNIYINKGKTIKGYIYF